MTWSVIEGDEKPESYRVENDDRHGGVLCWDGTPVVLPCRPFFRSWTTPWGARHHAVGIAFENGWTADLRLEDSPNPFPMNPAEEQGLRTFPCLTLGGANSRAINEREVLEEAGLVESFVGDQWDFSYEKTGYQYPGAYVQWNLYEPDAAKAADLEVEGQWASVPDLAALQSRLQLLASLPSDPEKAAQQALETCDGFK